MEDKKNVLQKCSERIAIYERKVADWLNRWQRAAPGNIRIRNIGLITFFIIYIILLFIQWKA